MDLLAIGPLAGFAQALALKTILGSPLLLYFGPETIMPITSVLAAAVGMVLIFWRHIITTVRNSFRKLFIKKEVFPDSSTDRDAAD